MLLDTLVVLTMDFMAETGLQQSFYNTGITHYSFMMLFFMRYNSSIYGLGL